jgi:hypothetical protein
MVCRNLCERLSKITIGKSHYEKTRKGYGVEANQLNCNSTALVVDYKEAAVAGCYDRHAHAGL